MAELLGRHAECGAVDHVLTGAAAGRSGVLVLRGEAGIGKSALLDYARTAAAASGCRVETSAGLEAEAQFDFAALHQLCAPMLDRADALPEPQREALGVAFGQRTGAAPDKFLIGLATLHLLAEVAEERPLVCIVDDGQWLDEASAQVLAFVARRLDAERIALLFAVREPSPSGSSALTGLPDLRLTGLGLADAHALLGAAVRTPLDRRVLDRIVAEAGGNPLALLELPQSAPPAELGGGFELSDAPDLPHRVEELFRRRSDDLPPGTRQLLLVAAADPTGDAGLLWQAAAHLGLDREEAAPAEVAGMVEIDNRVRFRHPLARSAVYQAASPPDRRVAHGALAAVTDPETDPDRRAWHRAKAVLGTDEEAAVELERSADRARARGGLAASAAFLQQAVELTPDRGRRAARAVAAARAKHDAGASDAALDLLSLAEPGLLDPSAAANQKLLRAQISFHLTRGSDAPAMLLDAAETLAPLDARRSRDTYLHAVEAAIITGGRGTGLSVAEVAQAAMAAPAATDPPRPADLFLDGLVTTGTQGYVAGVPGLRRALEAFRGEDSDTEAERDDECRRWLWLASRTAVALFDDELAYLLSSRNLRLAREAGSLATLPAALIAMAVTAVLGGELGRAAGLAIEETEIRLATGAEPLRNRAQVFLAGWRGSEADLADAAMTGTHGMSAQESIAEYARAVLHNGLGNYAVALDAAERACASDELLNGSLALPELIEAAARAEQPDRAASALTQLCARADASGTEWALGLAARSRALISTGPEAEALYLEAIERLGRCRMAGHHARTQLVFGEWLRREGRRQDAREQLRAAHDLLSTMGAEVFAARAARELQATGERPRKRSVQPTDALTEHEAHIARLVATGATNREVGSQLFLSPRTIEAHLRSIFRKLDITSRRQLRELHLP